MRIEGKKLKKVSNKVNILESIDISISSDSIYGLLGPNGAGKTSLFSILAGLSKPSEGEVLYDSKIVNNLSFEKRSELGVIYLPQEPSVFRELTVEENIKAALEAKKIEKKEIDNKFTRISEEFDLMSIKTQKCNSLSGGQRRRVEIARSLLHKPKLLLLDEPMAGMNVEEKQDMSRFIVEVNEEFGTTIALIEHDMAVVMDLADRVVVLDYGKLLADGTPKEVQSNQAVIDAYLGVAH